MTAMRLRQLLVLGIALFAAATPSNAADDTQDANSIKPEGEQSYKLIEIGDTKIDARLLNAAAPTPSRSLLGRLGFGERDYDEAAEIGECRAACKANARCREFAYARPSDSQPVGVCRLKAVVEPASFGVMAPVKDQGDPLNPTIREPLPAKGEAEIVFDDKETKGGAAYGEADARPTPVTLKFLAPIASAKVLIRAADIAGQRTWASVEAFDANGKLVERTGAWISVGRELNFGRAIAIGGETDRIATLKIAAREPGALLLEGVEFSRTLIAPPPVPETPAQDPTTLTLEEVPPRPALPPLTTERFSLPPRAVATEAPKDIVTPPVVAEPPPPAIEAPKIATPATPAAPQRTRGLPPWLALGAVAVMFAGAGLYWRNHRARTRARLTTRLVSTGLDRARVTVEGVEGADVSLRFVVRAPANTNFELSSNGVPA